MDAKLLIKKKNDGPSLIAHKTCKIGLDCISYALSPKQ